MEYIPGTFKDALLEGKRGLPFVRGIVCNSIREVDRDLHRSLEFFEEMRNVKLWFPGPLLPEGSSPEHEIEPVVKEIQKWLDKQSLHFVVYLSFGSHILTEPEQANEILDALLHVLKKTFHLVTKREQYSMCSQRSYTPSPMICTTKTQT